jgi:hypothetical protein
MRVKNGENRLSAIVMGLQGVSILGMWSAYIFRGVFRDGIRTVENNMYLGLHLLAEMVMGTLLIAGSIGVLLGRGWGRLVGLVGLGSVVYSTINSMADTIRNKPKLTPILVVNLVMALVMAAMFARKR